MITGNFQQASEAVSAPQQELITKIETKDKGPTFKADQTSSLATEAKKIKGSEVAVYPLSEEFEAARAVYMHEKLRFYNPYQPQIYYNKQSDGIHVFSVGTLSKPTLADVSPGDFHEKLRTGKIRNLGEFMAYLIFIYENNIKLSDIHVIEQGDEWVLVKRFGKPNHRDYVKTDEIDFAAIFDALPLVSASARQNLLKPGDEYYNAVLHRKNWFDFIKDGHCSISSLFIHIQEIRVNPHFREGVYRGILNLILTPPEIMAAFAATCSLDITCQKKLAERDRIISEQVAKVTPMFFPAYLYKQYQRLDKNLMNDIDRLSSYLRWFVPAGSETPWQIDCTNVVDRQIVKCRPEKAVSEPNVGLRERAALMIGRTCFMTLCEMNAELMNGKYPALLAEQQRVLAMEDEQRRMHQEQQSKAEALAIAAELNHKMEEKIRDFEHKIALQKAKAFAAKKAEDGSSAALGTERGQHKLATIHEEKELTLTPQAKEPVRLWQGSRKATPALKASSAHEITFAELDGSQSAASRKHEVKAQEPTAVSQNGEKKQDSTQSATTTPQDAEATVCHCVIL